MEPSHVVGFVLFYVTEVWWTLSDSKKTTKSLLSSLRTDFVTEEHKQEVRGIRDDEERTKRFCV